MARSRPAGAASALGLADRIGRSAVAAAVAGATIMPGLTVGLAAILV